MLEKTLRAAADRRARTISRRAAVTLTARDGAYAPDLARLEVDAPDAGARRLGPDGLLTFAVETDEPLYLSGELELEPSNDLRPGLRASVLCDDTLVAAPMLAEVRQAGNRGFIRESFVVPKANSWMIATRESDLQGRVPFSPSR